MRDRAMGVLFVLSGVFFVAGVLDPPILPTWGGSATAVMATASAHRTAWFASTWLLGQYAAFRGALPFPQFLAFIAMGIAALVHRTPAALSPGPEPAELATGD